MISVIILNWKRPGQVKQIARHLKDDPLVNQVIVMNNSSTPFESKRADVIQVDRDFGLCSRFMAAAFASETEILFHDDDVLIPRSVMAELHRSLEESPDLLVSTQGSTRPPGRKYQLRTPPRPARVDICLTRCCMISRRHLPYILRCMAAFWSGGDGRIKGSWNGEDIFLSYAMRQVGGKGLVIKLPEPYKNLDQAHAINRRPGFRRQRLDLIEKAERFKWPSPS